MVIAAPGIKAGDCTSRHNNNTGRVTARAGTVESCMVGWLLARWCKVSVRAGTGGSGDCRSRHKRVMNSSSKEEKRVIVDTGTE